MRRFVARLMVVGVVAVFALAVVACEEKGSAEKAGEKIDDAAKEVDKAMDDGKKALDDLTK